MNVTFGKTAADNKKPGRKPTPVSDHNGRIFESTDAMCEHYGINKATYLNRIKLGWEKEEALTKDVRYRAAKIPYGAEKRKGRKPTTTAGISKAAKAVAAAKETEAFIEACGLRSHYAYGGSIEGILKMLEMEEQRAYEAYELAKQRVQTALKQADKFRSERLEKELQEAIANTGKTYEEIISFLNAA